VRQLLKIFQYSSVIAGLLLPFVLVIVGGKEPRSFSQYYFTPAGPFFIGFLFWISIGLMSVGNWFSVFRGFCLQVVAAYDCHEYRATHNLAAILFFILSLIHILQDKRYRLIGYFMIFFSPICALSLYYGELAQILFISLYHFLYFSKLHRAFIT
jgi:hypothetical protein